MNELRTLDPLALDPFDNAPRSLMRPWRLDMPETAPRIKIDLSEQDGSFAVKAEIPGVKKEEISVTIDGNLVAISAEIKNEKEVTEGKKVLRSERYYGKVSRSFTLAQEVDEGTAEAKYSDGVLELHLPKQTVSKSKSLSIK